MLPRLYNLCDDELQIFSLKKVFVYYCVIVIVSVVLLRSRTSVVNCKVVFSSGREKVIAISFDVDWRGGTC